MALVLVLVLGAPVARADDDPGGSDPTGDAGADRSDESQPVGEPRDDAGDDDSPNIGVDDQLGGELGEDEATSDDEASGDAVGAPASGDLADRPTSATSASDRAGTTPATADATTASTEGGQTGEEDDDRPAGIQELGARLGITAGGRSTPGGFHLAGVYLYQMSDVDWFEGGVSFSFGSGDAACFRDRQDHYLCDHGALSGISGGISAGVRRFLSANHHFTPFFGGGLELRYVSFGGDGVKGLGLPAWLAGGVRARVSDTVAIAGEARYQFGIGWFNHDLGLEPQAALVVGVGVDFRLE